MIELLHGGMLIPTSVSLCCAVGGASGSRAMGIVGGVVMLLAMADFASGTRVLPTVVWAALLLMLALVTSAHASLQRRRREAVKADLTMALHRGLGLILTAALLLAAGAGGSTAVAAGAHAHAHAATGLTLWAVVFGATAAYAVFAVVAISHRLRDTTALRSARRWLRDGSLDIVAMTAGTVLMAGMVVVPVVG